jgi:hypothetical protein
MVIAVAMIASTALPPSASIARPACAANGCVVHTTLPASTGFLGHAYGKSHENGVVTGESYGPDVATTTTKLRTDRDTR